MAALKGAAHICRYICVYLLQIILKLDTLKTTKLYFSFSSDKESCSLVALFLRVYWDKNG